MSDDQIRDPREVKLPGWASNIISRLRSKVYNLTDSYESVKQENDRLRAVLDGKFAGNSAADTFLAQEDTGAEIPIGKGAEIRFADFYSVRYGDPREVVGSATANLTGGVPVLLVQTDTSMQIRPTMDPCVIIIARAG